jgi:hypothetical protein
MSLVGATMTPIKFVKGRGSGELASRHANGCKNSMLLMSTHNQKQMSIQKLFILSTIFVALSF